jgi:predicted O-methyltransferase YrrM
MELKILPGASYATCALPLDYPPSRDLRPRWGYSRPPIASLLRWFESYQDSYASFRFEMNWQAQYLAGIPTRFEERNLPEPAWLDVAYSPFDALALYTMIKTQRPRIYLEIGSGITTCFAHKAIHDAGLSTKIISIDPEPRTSVDAICDTVIREGLETCDLKIFDTLQSGDMLFLDGSHRSFMNSDVTVFFIDVLPNLKPGVMVHIHDITLPWDYAEMFTPWYWNEQYMLAVYLMGRMDRIVPTLPTAFAARHGDGFHPKVPGLSADLWQHGGAMWFTHR